VTAVPITKYATIAMRIPMPRFAPVVNARATRPGRHPNKVTSHDQVHSEAATATTTAGTIRARGRYRILIRISQPFIAAKGSTSLAILPVDQFPDSARMSSPHDVKLPSISIVPLKMRYDKTHATTATTKFLIAGLDVVFITKPNPDT
jgi:hypothetical protein